MHKIKDHADSLSAVLEEMQKRCDEIDAMSYRLPPEPRKPSGGVLPTTATGIHPPMVTRDDYLHLVRRVDALEKYIKDHLSDKQKDLESLE